MSAPVPDTPAEDSAHADNLQAPSRAAPPSADVATAARNGLKLAASLLATWTVALAVRFQLPRHLGPVQFGNFNFCEYFSAAFFVFLGLGIETYIQKEVPVRPRHASDFFGGVLVLRAGLSVLVMAAMVTVLAVTGRPAELQATVLIFALTQAVMGFNLSIAAMLQASTHVGPLAAMNVVSKLLWGFGVAIGIWLDVPLAVLAVPNLVAECLKALVLYPSARAAVGLRLNFSLGPLKKVLLASLPFYVNAIAVNLGARLDVSMLEFLAPGEEVGWYSAASNFAGLAMLFSPVVNWVLMPLFARSKHRSEERFYEILRRAIEGLLILAIPVTLLIGLGADFWVRLAFGRSFGPAALSLRCLAPLFVATYLAIMLALALVVLERSWRLTIVSLTTLGLLPLLILVMVPLAKRFGEGYAGAGAAIAVTSMELITASLFLHTVGRRALDRRNVLAIAKSIAVALAVIALHRSLAFMGPLRLIVDMLAYAVLALAVKAVRLSEAIAVIKTVRSERTAAKIA
jgi:O-antigen/teichoic acid export membrane protein